jgi:6-phosphogluconate dehydrogenase (decarboxylating)
MHIVITAIGVRTIFGLGEDGIQFIVSGCTARNIGSREGYGMMIGGQMKTDGNELTPIVGGYYGMSSCRFFAN